MFNWLRKLYFNGFSSAAEYDAKVLFVDTNLNAPDPRYFVRNCKSETEFLWNVKTKRNY